MDATQTAARRITRKYAYRGQQVTVELRDGGTLTGTLLAWGTSVIRVRTADGWTEKHVTRIARVTEAR